MDSWEYFKNRKYDYGQILSVKPMDSWEYFKIENMMYQGDKEYIEYYLLPVINETLVK